MSQQIKEIRALRRNGSNKLTKLRSQLTELAWQLDDKNQKLNDKNITQTLVLIDQSLVEIERALGQLNSIWLVDKSVAKVPSENLHNYKF